MFKIQKNRKSKIVIRKSQIFTTFVKTRQSMLIIGIAGGTGSGKTTVVNQIISELPLNEVGIISQDSYYKETGNLTYDERAKINFDHPQSIDFDLLTVHLKELKKGK